MFEDAFWTQLDIDVNAKLQQPQGYVGYPGGDLALEILAHNRQDIRLKSKAKKAAKKSNSGLYLGSAAVMGVLALGAYAYSKKGQKTVSQDAFNMNADPAESFSFQC